MLNGFVLDAKWLRFVESIVSDFTRSDFEFPRDCASDDGKQAKFHDIAFCCILSI